MLSRFGYAAAPAVSLRERLVPPMPTGPSRLPALFGFSGRVPGLGGWGKPRPPKPNSGRLPGTLAGWLGPLLIALLAGVLRFVRLGRPDAVIFDETYYPKDAWALLHHGFETVWAESANSKLVADPQHILMGDKASYIVHPPLGKWVMSLGEWMFGMNPFGWRFMTALLGTVAVLMVARIGRRLMRSTLLGCVAGLLLALDGLEFVMSRTALLDLLVMFWILAAFGCLLIDRDATRARVASMVGDRPDERLATRMRLGARPWRIAAGLCLGAATATKWNGLYVLAFFGVLTVLWDMGTRRLAGARRPFRAAVRRDAAPAFGSTVLVTLAVYVASWTGWFATDKGYFRHWADHGGGAWSWIPAPLRSLWHYHAEMYDFHTSLSTPHTYQSNPWSWLVVGRPVSYHYETLPHGKGGCAAKECAQEVLAIGTPVLWWAACVALLFLLFRWALRRDWRAGALLCGVAAGYLPWFMYQERTIFYFYAVVFSPFLCLAVAMMIGALIGPSHASDTRRAWGTALSGVLVAAVALNFIYFYPILSGQTIPTGDWQSRMWFSSWI